MAWWVRWRRLAVVVREASPLERERELDTLRRLEGIVGIRRSIAAVASETSLEPGIFGILKPVLVWPQGISQRLSDHQVEALLTHELCHVKRWDNLAAAMHMVVEAIFWFHPIVWWIENRLVDERERACHEAVIRLGSDPQRYAESILKTCEFYAESPLVCVSGVTGSDLKKRVEAIMSGHGGQKLNTWKRLLLAAAGIFAVAAPVGIGVLNAPPVLGAQPQAANASGPTFEVVSIKPNKSGELRTTIQGMQPGGRFTATNWTLRMLIRMAYRLQEFQMSGGPKWIDSDRFDIVAKADRVYTPAQLPAMIQTLLAERFKLAVHTESRDLRLYALVVASRDGKLGPRIHPSNVDCAALSASGAPPPPFVPGKVPPCATETSGGRHMIANGMTMSRLAVALSISAKGIVVDQTGLSGGFDLELEWTPESPTPAPPDAAGAGDRPADPGPSIFTAVQEQLGLKLDPQRGPVVVTIIDSAEQPTPD